jgi:hypothetical protein
VVTSESTVQAWLDESAKLRFSRSLWFSFSNMHVYLRAGYLKSYTGNHRLLGVCIANVTVEDRYRRQGLFSKFVTNLIVEAAALHYKEFQIENVISPEMLNFCVKCSLNKSSFCEGGVPSFWGPM